MARWIIALAALTCLSLPSTAQSDKTGADLRVVLWGGLKSGMSKAEVSQLYPKMQINITSECPAAIRGIYRAGRLTTVHLSLKGSRCQSIIIASMLEKYGPPDDSEVTDHQGLMRMLNSRNLIWIKDSVQIKLESATTGLKADVFYSRYESSNVESGADRL